NHEPMLVVFLCLNSSIFKGARHAAMSLLPFTACATTQAKPKQTSPKQDFLFLLFTDVSSHRGDANLKTTWDQSHHWWLHWIGSRRNVSALYPARRQPHYFALPM